MSTAVRAVESVTCRRYSAGSYVEETASAPRESPLAIYVNSRHMVTLMCTPVKVNYLAAGFLFSEGVINSMKDISTMRVCDDEMEVDVRLIDLDFQPAPPLVITSGCGGGATAMGQKLADLTVSSDLRATPVQITSLMRQLLDAAEAHREYGGLHTSAMATTAGLVAVAEDIGRHNTVDKVLGECLLGGIPTRDLVLLTTGRVSSEVMVKAGRMRVPLVISRGAITARAVSYASQMGITAVGYSRGDRFTVYTHTARVN